MKLLRGNTITIRWHLTRCDSAALDAENIKIIVSNYHGRKPVEYIRDGDYFSFIILAEEQRLCDYSIEAIYGKDGRALVKGFITFTDNPAQVTGTCENCSGEHIVDINSKVSLYVGRDGFSAYEIAVQGGYIGSESDWVTSLSQDSVDAANTVKNLTKELATAESTRVASEQDRTTNETARSENESSRTQSETTRIESEKGRISAESTRNTSEQARISSENSRVEAEKLRAQKVSDFAEAELKRGKAEDNRVTVEQSRVKAENLRQINTSAVIVSAEEATSYANTQAAFAGDQGDYAKSQGDAAKKQGDVAEKQGNDSVTNTNRAIDKANVAIKAANDAVKLTNAATANANEAVQNIDAKIAAKANQADLFATDSKIIRQDVINPRQGMAKGSITLNKDESKGEKAEYYTLPQSIYMSPLTNRTPFTVEYYIRLIANYIGNPLSGSNVPIIGTNGAWGSGNLGVSSTNATLGGVISKYIYPNTLRHVVYTFDGTTAIHYADGVKTGEKVGGTFGTFTEAFLGRSTNSSSTNPNATKGLSIRYNHLRFFNYGLPPEEVSKLYNGGRPDKYNIGNEFRGVSTNITLIAKDLSKMDALGSSSTLERIDNKIIVRCTKGEDQYPAITSIHIPINPNDTRKECKIKSKFKVISGTFGYGKFGGFVSDDGESLLYTPGEYEVESDWLKCGDKNQHNFFSGRFGQTEFEVEFECISISFKECIAEYLPSSLTQISWRDTSGQVNNLSVVTPVELDYSDPYPERIEGDAPPTIVPDFKGQIFADNTAKVSYEAWGTTSAADWKAR